MAFFSFLFDFYINIPYLKSQKGGSYLQVLMWRAGAADVLTWHVGPPRGCDAALRPRGRARGGPRGAHVAHRARTHGRWPRSPCVHADAREGCHVADGGLAVGGPTG